MFVDISVPLQNTSVTINALTDNYGVGSYILSIWELSSPITLPLVYTSGSNNPTNGARYVTSPISYNRNCLMIASSSSYDPFLPDMVPIWSNNTLDNLIEYQIAIDGDRPIWSSSSVSYVGDTTTYSSLESDPYSTGVGVIVLSL